MTDIDWQKAGDEAVSLLRDLLRVDTTNPPGNERPAAEIVAEALRADGIEPQVIESEPRRASVIARLRGTGAAPPLLLAGHLDVVPADSARWKHPPFGADVAEGCIWGRGAIDMKNFVAMAVTVVRLLAREGARAPRSRDVILAAVADEEAGCLKGSKWLVEHHPDLVRAEHALGEIGAFTLHQMGRSIYPIQCAEKGIAWMRATARGEAGHGSLPNDRAAVVRLSEAVARLGRARLPRHPCEPAARFVRALAAELPAPARWALPLLLSPAVGDVLLSRAVSDLTSRRSFAAILSNTATPTVLSAGSKTNVVPGEATCEIDGRILPGQTAEDLLREVREVVGPDLDLEVFRTHPATTTSPDTPLFRLLVDVLRRHDPMARPVPWMIPGYTDASAWSLLGTRCYGFAPVRIEPESGIVFGKLYHGTDERIPEAGFRWGLRVLHDVVRVHAA